MVWNKYKAQLKSFIANKVDDNSTVDDLLQEVSIKLYENIEANTAIKNYKSWLFQVTRNTIADQYRRHSKIEKSEKIAQQFSIKDYQNCPCDIVEFVIENYLPKKYAAPLLLSDIKKLPQKQVAQQLNLSLENTKSRIQRGRKQLRKMIEECVELEYDAQGRLIDGKLKSTCILPDKLIAEINKYEIEV